MTIKELIKQNAVALVFAIALAIVSAFFYWGWKGFVEDHILPHVTKSLEKEGYLRPQIKDGYFVVSDVPEFAKSTVLPQSALLSLKRGDYVQDEQLESLNSLYKNALDKQQQQIQVLKQENKDLQSELASMVQKYNELRELTDVLSTKRLSVSLFVSTKPRDKGKIVLNIHNLAISQALENGTSYKIYAKDGKGGRHEKLIVRIETNVHDKNFPKNAAIGRVHQDDYHDLFDGSRSGLRVAEIELK
jgi:hypothetical protein